MLDTILREIHEIAGDLAKGMVTHAIPAMKARNMTLDDAALSFGVQYQDTNTGKYFKATLTFEPSSEDDDIVPEGADIIMSGKVQPFH